MILMVYINDINDYKYLFHRTRIDNYIFKYLSLEHDCLSCLDGYFVFVDTVVVRDK